MEKRVLLAVALCLATYLVWYRFFPPPGSPPRPPQATISAPAGTSTAAPGASPGTPGVGGPGPTIPGTPTDAPVFQQALAPEQTTIVERPGLYRAVVTSRGAALSSYELLDKRYFTKDLRRLILKPGATEPEIDRRQTDGPMDLITSFHPAGVILFPQSGFTLPPVQSWNLVSNEETPNHDQKLVYRLESLEARLDKTLIFSATNFQVVMTVEVKNLKTTPVSHHFEVDLEGFQDPSQKPGGMFSARVPQNQALWDRGGKMQSLGLEALQEPVAGDKLVGDVRWIGVGQQYFLLAAALQHGAGVGEKKVNPHAQPNGAISISVDFAEKTLGPQESAVYQTTLYAGPKLPEFLDEVQVGQTSAGLKTAIDYTLEFLARPLLWILRQVHKGVGSWALSIVILTILVKLVTLYPSHRSMQSMKAMGALKPQIDELKLKYEDKQRFNVELMALYKKHNVNPIGGCLPMIIQMPIYFALYSMLGTAVELYRAQFYWIHDLTAADPLFILPLVTGGMMLLQSKISPASADPQQKMMANMMPIMFTVVSIFLPAGLTLYIMTNTILGMLQQAFINRGGLGAVAKVAVSPAK